MPNSRRLWSVAVIAIRRNPGWLWFAAIIAVMVALVILPLPTRTMVWRKFDLLLDRTTAVSGHPGFMEGLPGVPDPKVVAMELQQKSTIQMLAEAAGIPTWRVDGLHLKIDSNGWSANRPMPKAYRKKMEIYLSLRSQGQSTGYAGAVFAAMRGKVSGRADVLPTTTVIPGDGTYDWLIPAAYVFQVEKRRMSDGVLTLFYVCDGECAWRYSYFEQQGKSVVWLDRTRVDAKEAEPQFAMLMKGCDAFVSQRMKREGIEGFGSCHTFWRYKKEWLGERGEDWHSPSELNPGRCYDCEPAARVGSGDGMFRSCAMPYAYLDHERK